MKAHCCPQGGAALLLSHVQCEQRKQRKCRLICTPVPCSCSHLPDCAPGSEAPGNPSSSLPQAKWSRQSRTGVHLACGSSRQLVQGDKPPPGPSRPTLCPLQGFHSSLQLRLEDPGHYWPRQWRWRWPPVLLMLDECCSVEVGAGRTGARERVQGQKRELAAPKLGSSLPRFLSRVCPC